MCRQIGQVDKEILIGYLYTKYSYMQNIIMAGHLYTKYTYMQYIPGRTPAEYSRCRYMQLIAGHTYTKYKYKENSHGWTPVY